MVDREERQRDSSPLTSHEGRPINAAMVRIGIDALSVITFALMLAGAGVLLLVARLNSDSKDALIRYDNLHWWIGIEVEALLLLEVMLRALMPRFRSHISLRLALFFVLLAIGIGIKFSVGWAPPILLVGIGVVLLVARFFRV